MHRLALLLYDPYRRDDEYFEGVCEYADGLMQIDTRSFVEWWIYMYGSFEGSAVSLLSKMLGPTSVALDVGANVGAFTLVLARHGETVHAFEPHPAVRGRLVENLALNNLRNVHVSALALSDRAGVATLHAAAHANQGQSSLYARDDLMTAIRCEMQTLDEYVRRAEVHRVDLIKIDVEGAEYQVLLGAQETLAQFSPALYIEVNPLHLARSGTTPAMVRDLLRGLGYELWVNAEVERRRRTDRVRLTPLGDSGTEEPRDHYWLAIHPSRGESGPHA